jgi:Ig-like domain from next to BRCA1 gene
MKDEEKLQGLAGEDEPQVFKPEKEEGGWTFSRRDFLRLAVTVTAGAVVTSLPGVKDLLGRRVQLIAHSTELTQSSLQPGESMTKIWYLKNNADQPWGEGAILSLAGAAIWQAVSSIKLPNLAPGEITPVRVPMIAPAGLDPRPLEATVAVANEEFKIFLPIIHKSPIEPPCTCDSDVPCSCESYVPPCTCDSDIPCPCDYEVPCVCDLYYCPCDYEVPCVCDLYFCPCDYEVPCICDYEVPCGCEYYNPCGCVYYF